MKSKEEKNGRKMNRDSDIFGIEPNVPHKCVMRSSEGKERKEQKKNI